MKIRVFDGKSLSDSYLLCCTHNVVSQQLDPDLYDYEKVAFIHTVINAQWQAKVGLPFFDTTCISKGLFI